MPCDSEHHPILNLPSMHCWISAAHAERLLGALKTLEEREFVLTGATNRLVEMPILSAMGYPARLS